MNVYEYELSGMADIICDQQIQSNPDESEWGDISIPAESACENPF